MYSDKQDRKWYLITGKLSDELSTEELTEFDRWIDADDNKKLFKRVSKMHNGIPETEVLQYFNAESAWDKVNPAKKSNKVRQLVFQYMRYAAVSIVALLIGVLATKVEWTQKPVQLCEIKVPYGQTSEITLYDGTKVWLNSGSTLKYESAFNGENRQVWLEGEGFFEVHHNKALPFIVNNNKGNVEVLGTSFNVESYNDDPEIEVTLVEGSVKFEGVNIGKSYLLEPSYQLTYNVNKKKVDIAKVDTRFYTG
ncbi:hypothetical protein EYV94_01050 [Puteibacter caeruleilacunae]|nr:hypothetical protein EYV94_01050 [Puteibacter caeruleilacunae]